MHPQQAYNAGAAQARHEIENGHKTAQVYDYTQDDGTYLERQGFLSKITVEKIDPDSDEGIDAVTDFLNGYYDEWDDHLG